MTGAGKGKEKVKNWGDAKTGNDKEGGHRGAVMGPEAGGKEGLIELEMAGGSRGQGSGSPLS